MKSFVDSLADEETAEVVAAMKEVASRGLKGAPDLRGDIYEVRAATSKHSFRLLFSAEGRSGQVLLSLSAFSKGTQKTPPQEIKLAEQRLRDWRRRGGSPR